MALFRKKDKAPPLFVSAVIVAAGAAQRMGGVDKQQLMLGELPVVVRSVVQFCLSPRISEVVLVCRQEEIGDYLHMVQDFQLDKVSSVVAGGCQRQDSVFAGIAACSSQADFFAIHDGARPLILPEQIEGCITDALAYGAAAVGVPVKNTIKVRNNEGFISSTPDRASLWSIQTPQIFDAALYKNAMAQAKHNGRSYTDDCQLVEHMGHSVFISEGSYENIKITTPEDVILAHAILAWREGADFGI